MPASTEEIISKSHKWGGTGSSKISPEVYQRCYGDKHCPYCGCVEYAMISDKVYLYKRERIFKCDKCNKTWSKSKPRKPRAEELNH